MPVKGPAPILAIEGVDGAGKTLQCKALAARLEDEGFEVRIFREPGGSPVGEGLRRLLLERGPAERDPLLETLLFSASRRALVLEGLRPCRDEGILALLDRSFLSTWVYQGVAGGLDPERILEMSRWLHEDCFPDRILWIRLGPEEAARRRKTRGAGGDAFEDRGEDYLRRVEEGFARAAREMPDLVRPVDGRGEPGVVTARLREALDDLLGPRRRGGGHG